VSGPVHKHSSPQLLPPSARNPGACTAAVEQHSALSSDGTSEGQHTLQQGAQQHFACPFQPHPCQLHLLEPVQQHSGQQHEDKLHLNQQQQQQQGCHLEGASSNWQAALHGHAAHPRKRSSSDSSSNKALDGAVQQGCLNASGPECSALPCVAEDTLASGRTTAAAAAAADEVWNDVVMPDQQPDQQDQRHAGYVASQANCLHCMQQRVPAEACWFVDCTPAAATGAAAAAFITDLLGFR